MGVVFQKSPLAAGGDKCTLLEVIPMLWQEGCKHAVVKGDGGMGKTVSLVRLWDEFTKNYHAGGPVPVFIQLNEINTVPEEKRTDFILSAIGRDYFDSRVSADEIMRFLKVHREIPAVLLLLDDKEEIARYRFLLKCLLPALGYEMEKAGLFFFTQEQLHGHVDDYCARFGREDFLDTFEEYVDIETSLPLGRCEQGAEKRKRRRLVRDILVNKLSLLVEAEGVYGFLHQNFRDYFAAVHLRNEMVMGVKVKQVPELLRQGTISFFVRRFLGQIEGEHRARPVLVKGQGWKQDENRDSLLYKVLNLCRGHFDGDIGFAVWNIVETWKEVRGELSGADLSGLDLGKVELNGVMCSRVYGDDYLAARFDESLVHASNLFPQGHSHTVTSAVYSGDGEKILSASYDDTIKEWDAQSSQCLATYKGNRWLLDDTNKNWNENMLLVGYREKMRIKNKFTGTVIKTLVNIPGLWIQGCSFARLHPDCRLSEEELQLLKMYGARGMKKK